MVSRLSKLIWYNTRILLDWNAAAAFVLMVLAPFIFSFDLLKYKEVAKVAELYFPITGIILFTYIGGIENHEHAAELVNIRTVPHVLVLVGRMLLAACFIIAMIASVLYYAKLKDAVFPFWEITAGTTITAVFLGSIAFTSGNLTNQTSAGYIMAFAYYLMEYASKGNYTGKFYLFSLMKQDFTPKYYLLAAAISIFILNLIYIHKFKSKLNTSDD